MIVKILGCVISFLIILYSIDFVQHKQNTRPDPFQDTNIRVILQNKEFSLDTKKIFVDSLENHTITQKPFSIYGFKYWILNKQYSEWEHIINTAYIEHEIHLWEDALKITPPQEANIFIHNNELVRIEPRNGTEIDSSHITKSILKMIQQKDSSRTYKIFGRIQNKKPKVDEKYFYTFSDAVSQFLSQDFTLISENNSVTHTFSKEILPSFLIFVFNEKIKNFEIDFQTTYLEGELSQYNQEMQDAGFVINKDNTVSITPSQIGLTVDIEKTKESIKNSIYRKKSEATLEFTSSEPKLTTEKAEDLKITHPVVSFTTYFACCEARAKNIETVAHIIDGTLILPEEKWNLNTFIGKRTFERGFLPAGTIVKGSLIETTGGGISQFATTFYNAVYWGGYKDISHTPHSRYFSRYPEGIEATISWPEPHLIFQNNTSYGMLIDTYTTPTSITVRIFGNNDGRYIQGKHKDGITNITIENEGDAYAKIVESLVHNKTEIYPQKEIYYVDETIQGEIPLLKNEGRPSYSVDIIRTIKTKMGEILETKTWKTYYLSEDKEYLVRSCELAPENSICKTKEDIEHEKKILEEFFMQLEKNS